MSTVRDVVQSKGSNVVSVKPECLVVDAARLMMEVRIGGVLVRDSNDQLVGIFTERDVLRRVIAEQRDPACTPVSEVMTRDLVTVSSETSLDDCSAKMTERRVRHLPVMDDGKLCGIITPGDLLAIRVSEQETLIHTLEHYVFALQ